MDDLYGTRPDYLPEFARTKVVGADAVQLLDHEQSRQLAALSINRLEPLNSEALDFTHIPNRQFWVANDNKGARKFASLLTHELKPKARIVIFWSNLLMPTLSMSVETAAKYAFELLDQGPGFWIYAPDDGLMVEVLFEGKVTVARLGDLE